MKKFIALFICAFTAFIFEGCAPIKQTTSAPQHEAPAPAPKPAPQTKSIVRAKPAPKATPIVKKVVDYNIVTDNMYPIPKALDVDNDLTIVSLTPVSYTTQDHCNEVYFFSAIVTPTSGYHGIVDISMSERKIEGGYSCKYFGSAVVYQVKPNPFVKTTVKYEDVVRKLVPEEPGTTR